MTLKPYYEFRDSLTKAVIRDLIGPENPADTEVINDAPITRYISGILYPRSPDPIDPKEDIDLEDSDQDQEAPDPPIAMANVRYPSSMGLTFTVDRGLALSVSVSISAATYERISGQDGDPPRSADPTPGDVWRRVPLNIPAREVDVATADVGTSSPMAEGVDLFTRVRLFDKTSSVTLVLVNIKKSSPGQIRDADSLFQVGMTVTGPADNGGVFVERPFEERHMSDEDLRSYRLVYRHARAFAVGHGCSVVWEAKPDSERAVRLRTTFTPEYDLLLSDSNPSIEANCLSMPFLVGATRVDVVSALQDFARGYSVWTQEISSTVSKLDEGLQPVARVHIEACLEAHARMSAGINLLATDDRIWCAFRLANQAMLSVRARSEWLRAGKTGNGPDLQGPHAWRPFQLAFILICLRGIAEPNNPDRELTDLLWFPTGGGKTEAYLGLIAFTVFMRRLKDPSNGGGVTALMRYTLRLLTVQQFERAALLICACEVIRREQSDLGNEQISIGLWVGEGATPNNLTDARASLAKLRTGATLSDKNPVQLHSCPWCGAGLDVGNYIVARNPDRLAIACRMKECEFQHELPVHVVDEDIYRARPTLLIATADKFASLPWRDDVGSIFAVGRSEAPPELIIQDELHLISGPLGTLTGLYETVVDHLCTKDGHRAKVIASTATIRRAKEQSRGLFGRDVRQFPPPGLDARDSYFAVEARSEEKGSRRYLGLMAPGTSQATLLVRSYAALLQKVTEIEGSDDVKDPYWTLVGYFNSLRVLSGARMQVLDDVNDRIAQLANESGKAARKSDGQIEMIELTSRAGSGDIPIHLKQMAKSIPDPDTLDVILATNMISVGVDVDRLGLMAVMGQPQGTSEYIQATSRVGRRYPGLVVVLFNSARSRDRSHYESFYSYHSALYRQVEATSVTPFSPRARDRALHAVLIALARQTDPAFRANAAAGRVGDATTTLKLATDVILRRVGLVSSDEADATKAEIDRIIALWIERAADESKLVYSSWKHPELSLLVEASEFDTDDGKFPTLRSLRDVDVSSELLLVKNNG